MKITLKSKPFAQALELFHALWKDDGRNWSGESRSWMLEYDGMADLWLTAFGTQTGMVRVYLQAEQIEETPDDPVMPRGSMDYSIRGRRVGFTLKGVPILMKTKSPTLVLHLPHDPQGRVFVELDEGYTVFLEPNEEVEWYPFYEALYLNRAHYSLTAEVASGVAASRLFRAAVASSRPTIPGDALSGECLLAMMSLPASQPNQEPADAVQEDEEDESGFEESAPTDNSSPKPTVALGMLGISDDRLFVGRIPAHQPAESPWANGSVAEGLAIERRTLRFLSRAFSRSACPLQVWVSHESGLSIFKTSSIEVVVRGAVQQYNPRLLDLDQAPFWFQAPVPTVFDAINRLSLFTDKAFPFLQIVAGLDVVSLQTSPHQGGWGREELAVNAPGVTGTSVIRLSHLWEFLRCFPKSTQVQAKWHADGSLVFSAWDSRYQYYGTVVLVRFAGDVTEYAEHELAKQRALEAKEEVAAVRES